MKIKTTPESNNKSDVQESLEKLNKNIETLIAQKENEKNKTNSGKSKTTDDSSSYDEKIQKLQDKKEDKYREENRKLRDSLTDSLLPKDIRNPGINALAGGLLGIDPAVMQAFGVDKAVGSLFGNLKSKRRTNEDIKIESQRLNRRYETTDKTANKAKYGSVIQENEDTKYAKHFNELNKTLKEGFGSKKEQQEQKKEQSGFFGKVLEFLSGPMLRLIGVLGLGMLAIRGINLLLNRIYDAIADSWLGRQLGLKPRNGNREPNTGRDKDGKKNGLSDADMFLDEGIGLGFGLKSAGKSLLNKGTVAQKSLSLTSDLEGLKLTPQQKVAYVASHPEYAITAKEMEKVGLYENKGVYGWLNKAAKEGKDASWLGKTKAWAARQGLKAYPTVTKVGGKALQYGGKALNTVAIPLQVGAGTFEAGSAFAKGDDRSGYGAIAGTAGGLLLGGLATLLTGGLAAIPIGILAALFGDWGSRKISNAIYDANHPEHGSFNLNSLETDNQLSQSKSLEETERSLEQLKLTHDFQRNSMESLENIEKILKENQYQDKAYYTEDLRKNFWTSISGNNETPKESEFGNMTKQMETYSDLVFKS